MDRRTARAATIVALGGFIAIFDTTIVAVAIPVFMAEFAVPVVAAQWIVTGYVAGMATSMPLAAWLVRRLGARRVYLGAMVIFTVATVWAGTSDGLLELVIARVLQGIGGGLLNPVGTALVMRDVAPELRGRVMAITGLPLLLGPIAGPLLGGVILQYASWQAIFWVAVPLQVLALVGALRWIRRDHRTEAAIPMDYRGALLLIPGVLALTCGLGAQFLSGLSRALVGAIGLALMTAFVVRARTMRHPLLAVRLLGERRFRRSSIVLAMYSAAYFGSALLLPTYVQSVRGGSALTSGLLMVPTAIGMGIALQVVARVLERWGPRATIGGGLALALSSVIAMILVIGPDTSYAALALIAFAQGLGTGATLMPTMTSAIRNLQGADLGSGTALLGIISVASNAIGTAGVNAAYGALLVMTSGSAQGGELEAIEQTADPAIRATLVAEAIEAYRWTLMLVAVIIVAALIVRLRTRDAPNSPESSRETQRPRTPGSGPTLPATLRRS